MNYSVDLCDVEAGYIAAVRATVTHQTLGAAIRQILTGNQVYQFIKEAGLAKAGHNVIVYKNDQTGMAGGHPAEFEIEVGVQVAGPFTGNGQVICSSTPQGRAATTLHPGPYERLGQAHTAVMNWAKAQGHLFTGRSWEIYGDWQENPNDLTTQVFYLLK